MFASQRKNDTITETPIRPSGPFNSSFMKSIQLSGSFVEVIILKTTDEQ